MSVAAGRLVRSLAVVAAVLFAAPVCAAPHAGDVAPPFSLPRAMGGTVSLASYQYRKAVYVNVFASWCPPCNEEAPSVKKLYDKYRSKGLAVIGIDEFEGKAEALGFARKYGWPFAIALDDGRLGNDYGVFGLPAHVFIDKRGKISTVRLGAMNPDEIEDAIKKIL